MRFLLKMIKKGEIGKPISHAKMGKPILRYAERDFFRIVTIKCCKNFIEIIEKIDFINFDKKVR